MNINRFSNFDKSKLNESSPSDKPNYLRQTRVVIKGDKEAAEKAKQMVGDGGEPNYFFVTTSNDYQFYDKVENEITYYFNDPKKAPVKIEDHIETETFGPFETFKEAMKKADKIDLSESVGPRRIIIEDRKSGTIYERAMEAKVTIVWSEEVKDDSKSWGYHEKE